jgi:hypothetical protein
LTGVRPLTTIAYKTGFQLSIGGRVGQIRADDSFLGQAVVRNDKRVLGPGTIQTELEYVGATITGANFSYFDPSFLGMDISPAQNAPDARFSNNTFATAQFLSVARSSNLNDSFAINLRGSLGNANQTLAAAGTDTLDYYAISLLAGQTIEIQLLPDVEDINAAFGRTAIPRLGVFDPDNRLITTDYSNTDYTDKAVQSVVRLGKKIRITADRPGAYRIAIGYNGDINFNGVQDVGELVALPTIGSGLGYELRASKAGDIALGGFIAGTGHIATMDRFAPGIEVWRGDLGYLRAATIFSESNQWSVLAGNLRGIEAAAYSAFDLTQTIQNIYPTAPDLYVPAGSIGLLRSTAANQMLIINDDPIYPTSLSNLSLTSPTLAVGKNIQLIDAAGFLEGTYLANGGIGVVRAASIGGSGSTVTLAPVFQVNVDRKGNDGIIDLFDVTTNFGSAAGGPAITTGPGGNVRYIHVPIPAAGVFNAFRDTFFGGGILEDQLLPVGNSATLTDDSGTRVKLTPTPLIPNPASPLPTNQEPFFDPPQLSYMVYPIRDKSGGAIIRVTVIPVDDTDDGIVFPGGGGLIVESSANGSDGSVEIGEVVTTGTSNTWTFNPFKDGNLARQYVETPDSTDPNAVIRDTDLIFRGGSTIDIWNLNLQGAVVNRIFNSTNGEIININNPADAAAATADIVLLEAETLGSGRSATGAAVLGQLVAPVQNIFPLNQERTIIRAGDLITVRARRNLGHILANNIGNVFANSDRKNVSGVFEGVDGPILARHPGGVSNLTGNILSVNIGEGMLTSGNGNVGLAGVYADGQIDAVIGSGRGVDIRGDIVASGNTTFTIQQAVDPITGAALANPDGTPLLTSPPEWNIGTIRLDGGSIIDSTIITPATLDNARDGLIGRTLLEIVDTFTDPFFDVANIRIEGGGIIGTSIITTDLGQITINNGYGIINSNFSLRGGTLFQGITTDGYGIRGTYISTSGLNNINLRGSGARVSTAAYSSSVRFSETLEFDPYSGQELDEFNDLHKALGTSRTRPVIPGISESGVLMDTRILGTSSLKRLDAFQIIGRNIFLDNGVGGQTKLGYQDPNYPMRINFGDSAGTIFVRKTIDGLALSAGRMTQLAVAKDVFRSELRFAGKVDKIQALRLRSSTSILAEGPDGAIDLLLTKDTLYAKVQVSQGINTLSVGTDLGTYDMNVHGGVKKFSVGGSIVNSADIDVDKTINDLFIGRDIRAGSVLRADAIKKQVILGQISGDLIVG